MIFSKSELDHRRDVTNVLQALAGAGLVINKEKCRFFKNKVEFLGFVVNGKCVSINPERFTDLDTVINLKTVKQLQSALGFLGYFRKFIRNFSELVSPLHDVVCGKRRLSRDYDFRINEIRIKILEAEPLWLPNMDFSFMIETDASDSGLGAVLSQEIEGKKRIISFISRKLIPAERNYSTIEKELLAIVFGITKFRFYLHRKFKVVTNHQPLKWLQTVKKSERKNSSVETFSPGI